MVKGSLLPILEAASPPDDEETAKKVAQTKQVLDGLSGFVTGLDGRRSIVGEDGSTAWKVTGMLSDACITVADVHDIEGRLTVVGMVTKKIADNHWHSLVSQRFRNREQRRKFEREGPQ